MVKLQIWLIYLIIQSTIRKKKLVSFPYEQKEMKPIVHQWESLKQALLMLVTHQPATAYSLSPDCWTLILDAVGSSTIGAHFCDGESYSIIAKVFHHQIHKQAYTGIRRVLCLEHTSADHFTNDSNELPIPSLPTSPFNRWFICSSSSVAQMLK